MEDQQKRPIAVDLSWLAGIWEGDGSFGLFSNALKIKRKDKNYNYNQYAPYMQFTNTETDFINPVKTVLLDM